MIRALYVILDWYTLRRDSTPEEGTEERI